MAEDAGLISSGVLGGVCTALLSIWVGSMAYFAKKRDAAIDSNQKATAALELKMAENYATKTTVLALFQEATIQTKEAVARVEKSIDSTNLSVKDLNLKIDKVGDSINSMSQTVLHELSKKT